MSEQLDNPNGQFSNQLRDQQRAFVARVFNDKKTTAESLSLPLSLKSVQEPGFSDAQRLQLYHNNIVIGLRGALAGVYPVINKLVGDDYFNHVAREYSFLHPSHSGNLHAFGGFLPEFLTDFSGVENLVYLPDVARLEWAYHQVFHAQEDAVLNIQKLSSLDEESNNRLRFQVSNSCWIFSSNYPVLKIWQMNHDGNESDEIDLDEGGVQCVVRRLGSDVIFEPLNKAIFTLLNSLSEDQLFIDACAEVVAVDPECDVGAILKELIERRLLTGFSCS